jgi:predicted unusual protein kinase regulating ubiquinone biosynthesis (AarF/ABC1/UbiB family)
MAIADSGSTSGSYSARPKVRPLVADHTGDLIQAPNASDVTRYNPSLTIRGHGLRGWWRAGRILQTFVLYYIFVFIYHRGWLLGRAKEESEERHLRWQAAWLKRQLLRLGPTFIKIGQAMATRADLLPLAYIKELSTLLDEVPAVPNEVAFGIIERELGAPMRELYRQWEPTPVAAASLGQVYRAWLPTGELVAIKVQRPGLEQTINFDLAVLRRIAALLARYPRLIRGVDWEGTLDEFATVIFEEMDYLQEGRNAEVFRENFKDWPDVHVPRIWWSHSSPRVLTMEFIEGTKLLDLPGLAARGIDPPAIVRLVARTYLKQLLEDGYFHADPHPGNLRIMPDGRLAFFDFGMVGRITPKLQGLMIDAFFHIVERDVKGLTQDMINLGFLAPSVNPELIRPVVEKLFREYLGVKLGQIRFKDLAYELAEVVYQFPFFIPAHFTYMMRAIMTLEGMGIVMDPQFSFFDVAKPFAKEFMLRREGRQFRDQLLQRLFSREGGEIQWGKIWKLTQMAFRWYLDQWFPSPEKEAIREGQGRGGGN